MKFEMLTLCDGAYNYGGRLTIVGTYDNIMADKFPWQFDFIFAMKLFVPKDDSGKKRITIKFLDPHKKPFAGNMDVDVDIPISDANGHIAITSELKGVLFECPGTYSLLIEEDQKKIKEFAFDVIDKKQ